MHPLLIIYHELLQRYGKQGWWPLFACVGGNPTKTGSLQGYHPGDYSYPKNERQQFEICAGAILTQNTAWVNAEQALINLRTLRAVTPKSLMTLPDQALKKAVMPAGYFNQKAKKIREFTQCYLSLQGRAPTREELLAVWGIGNETADSILLYAYKIPVFVVDAYTKRIFSNLGFVDADAEYDEVQEIFTRHVPADMKIYQEYHALIVEHAKRHYGRGLDWKQCPLYRKYRRAPEKISLRWGSAGSLRAVAW
ncbi:endonuclease III domain-containing protein [Candidatus Woesearchaeota archaeon]|nr:endonuclease III domain-containing protein [Candidatus Woesearchaeota archaeon]